ncbi:RAQPRD family integrative conjugative element protein [Endozoicomonas sp. ALC066]|uniref:RAQPRD family integrative conjugative element protein n=1 Tax=Endozoicomonas sp. ALC066 TaxID=3403078 RepID=UPI003BB4B65A
MKKLIPALFLLSLTGPVVAETPQDIYQERETLSRLLDQVNNLMPIADLAERQSLNSDKRHRFDYVALKRDLITIQYGLTHYLKTPLEPRQLSHDLNGSYRQFNE